MGKGDKKSRKGKIAIGSFGKTRPHHVKKSSAAVSAETEAPAAPKDKKPSA